MGLEIVKKIIALGPLFIGAFVGIIPMLLVNIATTVIFFFLNSYFSGKFIGYSSWMQIKDIAPSYGIAFFLSLPVYFLNILPMTYWVILPMQVVLGIILFYGFCYVLKPKEYEEVKNMIIPFLKKLH